jgi:hypothetical protein
VSTVGKRVVAELGHACPVEAVEGLFGPVAIAVICSLLFVEEVGAVCTENMVRSP